MSRCNVMLVMLIRPPGSACVRIKDSPDLLGLTDATSNAGRPAFATDNWGENRDAFSGPMIDSSPIATTPTVARRSVLRGCGAFPTWILIVALDSSRAPDIVNGRETEAVALEP